MHPATTDAAPAPFEGVSEERIASLTETDFFCIDMLGKGYDPKTVAEVSGLQVTEVRELAEEFMPAIIQTRVEQQTTELALQDKAFAVEKIALERLHNAVIMETDSMKLMRIYNTMRVNNDKVRMEKRGHNPMGNTTINATIVRLEVPQALSQRQEFRDSITLDSASRVVAIGNKPIATANKNLIDSLAQLRKNASDPANLEPEDFQ